MNAPFKPLNAGIHGALELSLARNSRGATGLRRLYHRAPLRLLTPRTAPDEPFQGAITCVSGGIVGGDRLDIAVRLGNAAQALLIGQAGEKVYRSSGADSVVENSLRLKPDAVLEWLPQETILFDGARLRRRTCVHLATGAQFMGAEILVFGRLGSGERFQSGLLRDDWQIFDGDERLVWRECLQLDGDVEYRLAHRAGFSGARAMATIIARLDNFPLDAVRALITTSESCKNCLASAGRVGNIQLVRLLSRDAACLRAAFGEVWCALRAASLGRPAQMPVLWRI